MAILGIIADDFTGATDIAGMLVKGGMRTIQTIGVPATNGKKGGTIPDDVDAVVVALKSRSVPAKEAVAESLAALKTLQDAGCSRFFFKYCSTFDSTDQGNIGPVGDALLDALKARQAIYCPAFPENGRTIFFGHLFVGDLLLSDTHMRHHPLNPMTDSSLVRVLARQTRHKVGLVPLKKVQAGSAALRDALDALAKDGVRHVVVDAVADTDLGIIGEAVGDDTLVTGGSGVALGLPAAYRRRGLLQHRSGVDALPKIDGAAAVLAGSCSAATLGQIAAFKGAHLALDTDAICRGEDVAGAALGWAKDKLGTSVNGGGPILLSASDTPEAVKALQSKYGVEKSSHAIEKTMAALAKGLVAAGVGRMVVAGGETSGAVVGALDVTALRIGPEIDPGVPWTASVARKPMLLALKSGNFGAPDFFTKAFHRL
jgi:3-dehydrotetronate 4-kinase